MPSRINMGPDGGPYIAINENSGNIELEDNTGTTVAIWDDTNSQWDFQNNPISNVDSLTSNSLNTDDLDTDYAYEAPGGRASVQATIDAANSDDVGRINITAGNYGQRVASINRGQLVVGAGRDDPEFGTGTALDTASSDPVVNVSGINSMIKHVRVEQTGSGLAMALTGSASAAAWTFINSGNVEIGDADNIQFINNYLNGNDITILSGTRSAVVDGNSEVGTITDNGIGSAVGDNS